MPLVYLKRKAEGQKTIAKKKRAVLQNTTDHSLKISRDSTCDQHGFLDFFLFLSLLLALLVQRLSLSVIRPHNRLSEGFSLIPTQAQSLIKLK